MSRCSAFLALGAAIGAAGAQPPVLDERAFLDRVLARHPALETAAADLEFARAERIAATVLPNPALAIAAERPDGGPHQTDVLLEWSAPLDGRRALRRQSAESGATAAERDLASGRHRVRIAARAVYADWWFCAARAAEQARDLERIEGLARIRRTRAEAGEEAPLDALRLELEARRVRALWTAARVEEARAAATAGAWLGADAAGFAPARPVLPAAPLELDASRRDDIGALELRVRQAETERRLAGRVVAFPRIGLGWQRIEEAGDERAGGLYALTWDVPLLDRNQAGRAAAGARERRARAELELARREASARLSAARSAYALLLEQAHATEAVLGGADRAVTAMAAAFEVGERDVTDLLDTLRLARETRQGALEAIREAVRGWHELELASGRDLEEGSTR